MKWSLIQFVDNADDHHVFIIINIAKYIIVIVISVIVLLIHY